MILQVVVHSTHTHPFEPGALRQLSLLAVNSRLVAVSPPFTHDLSIMPSAAALLSLLASSAVATPLFTPEEQVALAGPIRTADKWSWTDCGMPAFYVVNNLLMLGYR